MDKIIRIGMDTSKCFFQLHGVDAREQAVLRQQLTRAKMLAFFEKLAPTTVAIEACGASHHWARITGADYGDSLLLPQPLPRGGHNPGL